MESLTRSLLISCSICAKAAMIVNNIEPIGDDVSTSPPPKIQNTQPRSPTAQLFRESQHVLSRTPQAIERGDHQGVASDQRLERCIELRSRRPSATDAVINGEVIAPDTSGKQVNLLPVGRLLLR